MSFTLAVLQNSNMCTWSTEHPFPCTLPLHAQKHPISTQIYSAPTKRLYPCTNGSFPKQIDLVMAAFMIF